METSTRSTYYRTTLKRGSYLKAWFLTIAVFLTSYPRMMIEVFTRKNFGVRYFNIWSVITLTVLLYWLPFNMADVNLFGPESTYIMKRNWAWYLFTVLFLVFGIRRWLEIRQAPSTFNFSKYSQYMGDLSPIMDRMGVSVRTYEIIVEPALFMVMGLLLQSMEQSLGMLFIVASILYSCSYIAAYMQGDDAIQDMIDEIIFGQNIKKIMIDGAKPQQANGVQLRGNMPSSPQMRQDLLERMIDDADSEPAVAE